MSAPPVPVADALQLIAELAQPRPSVRRSLLEACQRPVARDLIAPRDLPGFDNSQMDGYALAGLPPVCDRWRVIGLLQAGSETVLALQPGEAARVYTGSPLPSGTDAVVMQEFVTGGATDVIQVTGALMPGQYIRKRGSDLAAGAVALSAGEPLTPAAVGLLSSLGVAEVDICQAPRIGLFTSGDEVVPAGNIPLPHQIIDGNLPMLAAALQGLGLTPQATSYAPDQPEAVRERLKTLLEECDVILTTGGVSVGDFDFVQSALSALGATPLLWRVRQRPGKPLLIARGPDGQVILGLPGNPVSALTCFYIYAWPLLRGMLGFRDTRLPARLLPLMSTVSGIPGLMQFLRGAITPQGVVPLEGQGSHQLSRFAHAQCLIVIPESEGVLPIGTPVTCHLLPGSGV